MEGEEQRAAGHAIVAVSALPRRRRQTTMAHGHRGRQHQIKQRHIYTQHTRANRFSRGDSRGHYVPYLSCKTRKSEDATPCAKRKQEAKNNRGGRGRHWHGRVPDTCPHPGGGGGPEEQRPFIGGKDKTPTIGACCWLQFGSVARTRNQLPRKAKPARPRDETATPTPSRAIQSRRAHSLEITTSYFTLSLTARTVSCTSQAREHQGCLHTATPETQIKNPPTHTQRTHDQYDGRRQR